MARTQVVARLGVDLVARTAEFVEGFKRATIIQQGFGRELAATTKRVLAYAASYLAIRRVTREFIAQASAVDNLAKTSRKLGLATEHLAQMQYAASVSGVEIRKLNMGIQRMTRRMAEAAVGTGEARNAIKDLGLDAKALGALSPDQQFLRVAEAMEQVTDSGQRVRYAFKLFDSEGVDLVNMLNEGAGGLRRMYEEADRLGISITTIQAAKVEAAHDQLTRVKALLAGIGRSVIVELAPLLEQAAGAFTDWAISGRSAGATVVGWLRSASMGVGYVLSGVDVLKAGFYSMGATASAVGAGLVKALQWVLDGIGYVGLGIDKLEVKWLGLKASTMQATAEIMAAQYELTGLGGSMLVRYTEMADAAEQARERTERLVNEGLLGAGATIRGVANELDALSASMANTAKSGFAEAEEIITRVASEERLTQIKTFYAEVQTAADDAARIAIEKHRQMEDSKTTITAEQLKKRAALISSDTTFVISGLQDIVANSRMAAEAQFNATKALKLGQTVMNTAAAYMEFMAQGRPGMAKFAVAMGAIQAAAIAATTYEGGGSVTSSAATSAAEPEETRRTPQSVNVVLQGGQAMFSREQVIQILGGLNEVLSDGYVLNVSG